MQFQFSLATKILAVLAATSVLVNSTHAQIIQPTAQKQSDRCRVLMDRLADFYIPDSLDKANGGFCENLNAEGKFVSGEKFLTLQARQIWFFSNLAVHEIDRTNAAAMAEHGHAGLQEQFFDHANGGYFLKVAQDGTQTDNRKHAYPLSFVIYGLVELHRANGSKPALTQALELFELLDKHCYDQTNGGYNELFTADWQEITDTDQWGVVGTVGFKTYNTHLHLLEAFTQLYLATHDERVAVRLKQLIEICTTTIKHPVHNCNIDAWTKDWKVVKTESNLRVSYGHDLECAWLVLAAADAINQRPTKLEQWATRISDHAIQFGQDKQHGGFFYSGPFGQPSDDRKKEWWTQTEAMVALLTLYEITNDENYLKAFESTLDFVEKHHVAENGSWYASLNEDGSIGENKSVTSMWQGGYHNGRALILCEKMLRKLGK